MPNIFVITGPSGAGKTTIAEQLLLKRPNLRRVITCTTRPARGSEQDGVAYHFVSLEDFLAMRSAGQLFEWAEVYPGRFYGSRACDVRALLDEGYDVVFVIDVKGARNIKRDHPEAVTIFVDAESVDELVSRIAGRDQGETADLAARMEAIAEERVYGSACDYLVVNRTGALEETVAAVASIMDETKKAGG